MIEHIALRHRNKRNLRSVGTTGPHPTGTQPFQPFVSPKIPPLNLWNGTEANSGRGGSPWP